MQSGKEFEYVTRVPADGRKLLENVLVFCVLVAIGVFGRWGQPDWGFTPIAAVTVFASFYFARIAMAAMVPLAILVISDLALPAYNSQGVMLAVHVALLLPIFLGLALRSPSGAGLTTLKLAACGLVPATVFFLMTNWAVWQFQSDYEPTLSGLAACYAAAVPFYRAMLAGDVFYMAVVFACYYLAMAYLRRPLLQPVASRSDRS